MIVARLLILSKLSVFICPTSALPLYHQADYDVKIERIEIVWYNPLFAKDFKATNGWYNRTLRAFNASGNLLISTQEADVITIEIQLYKFMSNEYRFFPVTVAADLCKEYANNNFGMQSIVNNKSNLHKCPLEKGFYYAYNIVPDFSRFPPFIPHGRYKAACKMYFNKLFVFEGHGYYEIMGKPINWQ